MSTEEFVAAATANDGAGPQREMRSFLMARDPSIDRRFRPRPDRQVRLFDDLPEGDDETDDDTATEDDDQVQSMASSECNSEIGALVYLRLRPVEKSSTAYTVSEGGKVLITGPSSESTSTSNNKNIMEKHYSFSTIFEGDVGQREVYEKCVGQRIEAEEDFTMLTYGTSGSGKTFTLLGDEDRPGIIPRCIENIFTLYNANIYPSPSLKLVKGRVTIMDDVALTKETQIRRQILGACVDIHTLHARMQQSIRSDHAFETTPLGEVSVLIWISFVEIYNENVYDLLEPPARTAAQTTMSAPLRKNLRIVGNDGKVFIRGLTSVYVKSSLEALQLLRYGLQRVNYASTSINSNSSRSHCIFFVDVLKYFQSGLITETSYKFCDLAGSERLHKTGNVGSRLKEAQRINTSLMVLGRCLDAANTNSRKKSSDVIPYRESRLTMLLQSALLGKEKLTMIVNVTPIDKYYEENLNVLGFSSIAKNIIFKQPLVKQNSSRYSHFMECSKTAASETNGARNEYLEQLLEENIFLRTELDRANYEMENLKTRHSTELLQQEHDLRNKLVDSFQNTMLQRKKEFESNLQQELDSQKRNFENKIAALKREYENQIEDLRDEWDEEKENLTEQMNKKVRTME